jgi:hypothetical protein
VIHLVRAMRAECTRCHFTVDFYDLPRSRWRAAVAVAGYLESEGWHITGRHFHCPACVWALTELADLPETGEKQITNR